MRTLTLEEIDEVNGGNPPLMSYVIGWAIWNGLDVGVPYVWNSIVSFVSNYEMNTYTHEEALAISRSFPITGPY